MEKYYQDFIQRIHARQRQYDNDAKKEKWLDIFVAVVVGAILLGALVLG